MQDTGILLLDHPADAGEREPAARMDDIEIS